MRNAPYSADRMSSAPRSVANATGAVRSPHFPSVAILGYGRGVESIRYEFSDATSCISLDDGKANVMSVPFFVRLGEALDRAEHDNARLVVFRGRAGMFSGGLDMRLLPSLSPAEIGTLAREFARTMLRVFTFPAPTAAAVTGHAIAGGAILALACDRRFSADGPFRFQINEVAIGIPVPSWMLLIAQSAVPPEHHVEAILHARVYDPQTAAQRGLVNAVVPANEDVVSAIRHACGDLAALAPAAYAETKRRMRAADVARVLTLLEDELPG
jgi:enoyl-CoA hydratase